MKSTIQCLILGFSLMLITSCEKDDEKEPNTTDGNILITTMLPNPDGMSGAAYFQLIDNMKPKAITNGNARPMPFSSTPCVSGNDVFIIPGWGGDTDIMTKYSRIDGKLIKQGEYPLPEQSGATNVVTKGNLAYVSCALIGKILILNHTDMTLVKELDISAYGIGDQNPNPSSMLIRDNLLFVPLTQMVGGYFPAPGRPYSDVLIINTDNNEVVKMITEKTSNISCPTRPTDPSSIFMDENKNIYISCLGAWGAVPGHNAGLLRIKAGETEFDENYKFVLNSTNIEGEPNSGAYYEVVKYIGNGKMYATVNIPAYYSNPINYIEDRVVIAAEIDIVNKTIKKLDLPKSSSYGVAVGEYEGNIIFGLATNQANGFYTYNPLSQEASKNAIVSTTGYPFSFYSFE